MNHITVYTPGAPLFVGKKNAKSSWKRTSKLQQTYQTNPLTWQHNLQMKSNGQISPELWQNVVAR